MQNSLKIDLARKTKLSQAFFNPLLLSVYDLLLYRFISPMLWGYSVTQLLDRYRRYIGARHLEVGVGTGYLMDCFNPRDIDLSLLDLNESCLRKSAQRLLRFSPRLIRQNILESIPIGATGYDSISLNYVMHCVAGSFATKGIAFANLKPLLKANGLLFGITVMKTSRTHPLAAGLMVVLNALGVFNNRDDEAQELEAALRQNFQHVALQKTTAAVSFIATDDLNRFRRITRQAGADGN